MGKAVVPDSIVLEVLDKDNYDDWSETIRAYLEYNDLWDVVESNEQPPDREADEAMFKSWNKKNSKALHAIKISCGRRFISKIRGIREANNAWRTLKAYFYPALPTRMEYTINPQQGDEENVDDKYMDAYKLLADAFSKKDISDAIELCKKNPVLLKERLPNYTPLLHQLIMLVSDYSELEKVVEMLKLDHFPKEALEMTDSSGRTPLAVAIDSRSYPPLINELYSITPPSVWTTLEDGKYGATVITKCIEEQKFEFASTLLKEHPDLIFTKDVNGLSPLYVAARAPCLFELHIAISPYTKKFRKFANYFRSIFFPRRLPSQTQGIEWLIAIQNAIRASNMTIDHLRGAFFEAIKCGNFNFILMLINYKNKILEEVNDMSKNIYMCAIEYRQPKVFSLLFWDKKDCKDRKLYANVWEDKWKNNLLHMAATWTPPDALDRISESATLILFQNLLWYKEVCGLAPDLSKKANVDANLPSELFVESHRDLKIEAEKRMKESASSWAIIVGPLIITIMFAAAFQIPGGYNQEMGIPIFLNKKWFKLYMVLVSIALFLATISVLKFLEIFSSDDQGKDSFSSLGTYLRTYNMITGSLFLSLATMLVAFCLGLFLTLHGELAIFLPIAVIAILLVGNIVYTKFHLFVKSFVTSKQKISLFEKNIGDEVELIFNMLKQKPTKEVAT